MQLEVDGGRLPRPQTGAAAGEPADALLAGLWRGPAALALLDAELRFVDVNDAFARLTGAPRPAFAGLAPRDLLPDDEALAFAIEDRLRAVLESGEPALDLTATSRAADGTPRSWRASLYPAPDPDGAARGVVAVVDETTAVYDRERAIERAWLAAERSARRLGLLQDVTASLSAAVDVADVGRVAVERARAFAGADAACLRVLEGGALVAVASAGLRTLAAWAGSPVPTSARTPSADAARSGAGVWLESEDDVEARYPALLEAGRAEGWACGAALPLRARGHVIGTLSLSFRARRAFDLEDRALLLSMAEHCALALDRARLLASERAQRRDAEHDRAVVDGLLGNAPVGVALLGRDLRFLRVNAALAAIHGVPIAAHAGRMPDEVLPSLPWGELAPALRRVLDTGEPQLERPVEVPSRDGTVRSFLASSYRVQAGGETTGVGVIVRDVTAEREAEQFQRNVLGIVGHDLRTPLATITNATYLLERTGALGPASARVVSRISAACARIQQVIGILLEYARASRGGGVPVRARACDVAALCREVADEVEGANPGREIRCGGEGDPAGAWDPDRVRQALANLVSNAVQHGAPGAPIEVRWRGDADRVEIEVANAGPPIPADLLPRIFDAFRRGARERAGGAGGLGLGLFIARAIAVAHGGRIDVRSGDGETAFTLRLPRRPPLPG